VTLSVRLRLMCRGVKPSCGVHSLFIHHDLIVMPPVVGLRTYAKGCHACDALVDEFGEVIGSTLDVVVSHDDGD
jgi:hypothetical protein